MSDDFPQKFWQGVEEFNTGQFYACHDSLEEIWLEAVDPEKTFYQGILQIAVAFYHLGNHNWRGCAIMLGEGTNRLRRYRPEYNGIDVEDLFLEALTALERLQATPETEVAKLARQYGVSEEGAEPSLPLPQVRYRASA